jgi:hypothetical protein
MHPECLAFQSILPQEVTEYIHILFQEAPWWTRYKTFSSMDKKQSDSWPYTQQVPKQTEQACLLVKPINYLPHRLAKLRTCSLVLPEFLISSINCYTPMLLQKCRTHILFICSIMKSFEMQKCDI